MNESLALLSLMLVAILLFFAGHETWVEFFRSANEVSKRIVNKRPKNMHHIKHNKRNRIYESHHDNTITFLKNLSIFSDKIYHGDFIKDLYSSNNKNKSAYSNKGKTVFCLFLEDKDRESRRAMLNCSFGIIFYTLMAMLDILSHNFWPILLLFTFGISTKLDFHLAKKRGLSGEYGGNRFEAEELIKFIIDNSDSNKFGGPDGKMKIMPDSKKQNEDITDWGRATNGP